MRGFPIAAGLIGRNNSIAALVRLGTCLKASNPRLFARASRSSSRRANHNQQPGSGVLAAANFTNRKENMSFNKNSGSMGFGRLCAALASPLAVRTLVAVSTLGIACLNGFTQSPPSPLLLDGFTTGPYVETRTSGGQHNSVFLQLPPGSPLGQARATTFSVSQGVYAHQFGRLVIETVPGQSPTGICAVDTGFGDVTEVLLEYGWTLSGVPSALALNLGDYSAFRVNFAGVAGGVTLDIEVYNGSTGSISGVGVGSNGNLFSVDIPFSSFPGELNFSDITAIYIIAESGYGSNFGITSFEAVN